MFHLNRWGSAATNRGVREEAMSDVSPRRTRRDVLRNAVSITADTTPPTVETMTTDEILKEMGRLAHNALYSRTVAWNPETRRLFPICDLRYRG